MIFRDFTPTEAEGVLLAHTLKLPGRTLRKGRRLDADDIAALTAAGIARVAGARLADHELDEDAAAAAIGALLGGSGLIVKPPATGRCNLYAAAAGVLRVDRELIDRVNRISETVTIGTLAPYAAVTERQRIATVKVIPFAVPKAVIEAWRANLADTSPLALAPFRSRRAALILSRNETTGDKVLDATEAASRARLESTGSHLALVRRCAHEPEAIRGAIDEALAAGCELLLISGASVSKDRGDVVPAGIVAAGGEIVHFGMPVEPGNMLLLARLGPVPVVNLPGCARSRRTNGLDWVLQRMTADLPLGGEELMSLGAGGLIRSAEGDDEEGEEAPPVLVPVSSAAPAPRIAALVLAAGRGSRIGGSNKLLCEIGGIPLVRRAVNAACASRCSQVMVVTGFEAARTEAALDGTAISVAHNPDYVNGISTSLRCGLKALPSDLDGVVVLLADMPRITAADVDRLIAAFDPRCPAIVVPERNGRRGNPVLWPRRYFAEMRAIRGDTGARGLLRRHAEDIVAVAFDSDAIFTDVDTPEALEEVTLP